MTDSGDVINPRIDDLRQLVRDHAAWTEQAHHELGEQLTGLGRAIQEARAVILEHAAQPYHAGGAALAAAVTTHAIELRGLTAALAQHDIAHARESGRAEVRNRLLWGILTALGWIAAGVGAIALQLLGLLQIDVTGAAQRLIGGGS